MCGFESPGTWRANVKVEFFDGADTLVATVTGTDTATFRQRFTETTLTRSQQTRTLVARVNAEVPGGGFAPCKRCFTRVQRASGGKWKAVDKGLTNSRGELRTGYRPSKGQFRAVTPGFSYGSINAPSQSAIVRVR